MLRAISFVERLKGAFFQVVAFVAEMGRGWFISHMLYADDTIIFYGANQDQMMYLSWLLMWFESISGLRINLNKSEIIPVGRITDVDVLALELGYKVGALHPPT